MKIKKDINLNNLLNLGFEKIFKYKGNFYRSGYIKTLKGYAYVFYNKNENTKNSIIYIDKNTRVVDVLKDDYSKIELEMQERVINDLIKNNLVEI